MANIHKRTTVHIRTVTAEGCYLLHGPQLRHIENQDVEFQISSLCEFQNNLIAPKT